MSGRWNNAAASIKNLNYYTYHFKKSIQSAVSMMEITKKELQLSPVDLGKALQETG